MKAFAIASLLFLCGCSAVPSSSATFSPSTRIVASSLPTATAVQPVVRHEYRGAIVGFGDSIMLGAQPCLEPLGFVIDAVQGRTFQEGMSAIANTTLRLPKRVLIGLGTNGEFTDAEFDSAMEMLSGHQVYWVTVHLPDEERYAFANALNGSLRKNVDRYPNAHVIDWDLIADEHPEWLYDDGIHLREEACQPYADVMNHGVRAPSDG